jgi:trehalose 6-phosphate phosphatase
LKIGSRAELTKWALEAPQRLWLFLDYDGTLADFAPTPEHVEPQPEVIRRLEQLSRRPGVRITILSGRRLAHVRQLVPVPGIILAGTYGIELLSASGETVNLMQQRDIRSVLDAIKPEWAGLLTGRRGFFLEDKDWTLALHARFAPDEEAAQVLGEALEIATLRLPSEQVRILGGHKFLEVAPRLANKREAVAYLLKEYPLPEASLVYVGDDDKDEEAFPLIQAKGGIAVKVLQPSQRAQETRADVFFDSPQETLTWLEELLGSG